MQQYSIVVIVFLYLFLTSWHSHFQCWNFFPKMYKDGYLTNKYSYMADFADLDAVYGSDDGLKRNSHR